MSLGMQKTPGFAPDWSEMSDDQLADIARAAFKLGLHDGRTLAAPIDKYRVMAELSNTRGLRANGPKKEIHFTKLRQVYGAAFDLAKGHR